MSSDFYMAGNFVIVSKYTNYDTEKIKGKKMIKETDKISIKIGLREAADANNELNNNERGFNSIKNFLSSVRHRAFYDPTLYAHTCVNDRVPVQRITLGTSQ